MTLIRDGRTNLETQLNNYPTIAIIVAGGRGTRITPDESNLPKQYRMLGGKCILQRTIDVFTGHTRVDQVQVVIHKDDYKTYEALIGDHPKLLPPVKGGTTRQQSVFCGLKSITNPGAGTNILVHDAARPFVEPDTISQLLNQIKQGQGAIPAHALADTLKQSGQNQMIRATLPRDGLYCAQTPQGFLLDEILQVHDDAASQENNDFTDDASMFEAAGSNVRIIPSPSSNFKITTDEDLAMARMIYDVSNAHPDIRTGNGYDVHAFEEGDGVMLCGLKIPFDRKLNGHSDADVALHALSDALLGTIGAGDIGTHFPPSDIKWKDAASHLFLTAALDMITEKHGRINNIDITIICEAPKIGPHRIAMQEHLAKLCGLDIERVSIKATTNEKLGFLGRGEGIAALASATVSFGART